MARLLSSLLLILLCSNAWAFDVVTGGGYSTVNNFMDDADCVAVYRFEDGALTTDSRNATPQTLTNSGTVTADTSVFVEGAASSLYNGTNQYFYRNDSDLISTFPLKNGTTNNICTMCAWVRIDDAPDESTENIIIRKYGGGTDDKRSFSLGISDALAVSLLLGVDGGADLDPHTHGSTLDAATWYFVCGSYENSGETIAIRVRSSAGAVVGTDYTGNLTGTFNIEDSPFTIGAAKASGGTVDYWDGRIDLAVVFKRVLTADEVTRISKGIFP